MTSTAPDATYAGPALSDGTRYWWTVRTIDAQGRTSQWARAGAVRHRARLDLGRPADLGGQPAGREEQRLGVPARQRLDLPQARPRRDGLRDGHVHRARPPVRVPAVAERHASSASARPEPPDPVTDTEYSAWDVTSALQAGHQHVRRARLHDVRPRRFQLELVVQYKDGTTPGVGDRAELAGHGRRRRLPGGGQHQPRATTPRRSRTSTPSTTRSASTPPATRRPGPGLGAARPSRATIAGPDPRPRRQRAAGGAQAGEDHRARPRAVPARLRRHPGRRAPPHPGLARRGRRCGSSAARCCPAPPASSTS